MRWVIVAWVIYLFIGGYIAAELPGGDEVSSAFICFAVAFGGFITALYLREATKELEVSKVSLAVMVVVVLILFFLFMYELTKVVD